MRRYLFIFICVALLVGGYALYQKYFWLLNSAVFPPSENIEDVLTEDPTNSILKLPEEFSLKIFATNLPGARVLRFDSLGNLWVSQTKEGMVSLIELQDKKVIHQAPVFKDLKNPHGLAFDPQDPFLLYIAEEDKLSSGRVYSEGPPQKIIDLPYGQGHFTRTIGFGPDERLYVSVGSSCNVCREEDQRRAALLTLDTKNPKPELKPFAQGLRNTVFFTWHPETKELWGTDNGRDQLGDDLPPDEINIIKEGGNYGWPICYGANIHDGAFDKNTYIRNPCMTPFETPSHIDLQAHSAPLGLAFIPGDGWSKEYRGDLLVSFHGSWNRSEPTGYKVVRIKLDEQNRPQGIEDFVTGWLRGEEILGRPVDLVFTPWNTLLISDDKAGVIYEVSPKK